MPKTKRKPKRAAPHRRAKKSRKPRPVKVDGRALRQHVLALLEGGGAHVDFEKAIAGLPAGLRGVKPAGAAHTAWQLLEHLRIAQWDILEFSRDPKHVSPEWTRGYWPQGDTPPNDAAWDGSLEAFRADLKAMKDLVADRATDLLRPIPHGDGQTILREALLVADHNAYHLGQFVMLRRLLGAWPDH
jgi:DinB family protein